MQYEPAIELRQEHHHHSCTGAIVTGRFPKTGNWVFTNDPATQSKSSTVPESVASTKEFPFTSRAANLSPTLALSA